MMYYTISIQNMILQWQQTDKNQFASLFAIYLKNLNNVKHIVEDTMKQAPVVKRPKKGKNRNRSRKRKILLLNNKPNYD